MLDSRRRERAYGKDDLLPADGAGVEHGVATPPWESDVRRAQGIPAATWPFTERRVEAARATERFGWAQGEGVGGALARARACHVAKGGKEGVLTHVPSHPSDLSLSGGAE